LLCDIHIDWGDKSFIQTPEIIPPVWSGSPLIVFAFVEKDVSDLPSELTITLKAFDGSQDRSWPLKISTNKRVGDNLITSAAINSKIK
jgi:hypothetical protein